MTAIAGEGTGMERDYDFTSAIHGSDLLPPGTDRHRGWRARRRRGLNPRKVATCKAPVVFDPRVAGSLVRACGRRRERRIDRAQDQFPEGQPSASSCSTRASGSSTIRCGSAGCARSRSMRKASAVRKLAIIDEGVLTSWLLDSATARELGLATTGHAQRGVSSSPSPGSDQSAYGAGHAYAPPN